MQVQLREVRLQCIKILIKKMAPLPGAMAVDYASKATNGAAMKIAPAGILNPGDIEKLFKKR